jgi:hypothetical protein
MAPWAMSSALDFASRRAKALTVGSSATNAASNDYSLSLSGALGAAAGGRSCRNVIIMTRPFEKNDGAGMTAPMRRAARLMCIKPWPSGDRNLDHCCAGARHRRVQICPNAIRPETHLAFPARSKTWNSRLPARRPPASRS